MYKESEGFQCNLRRYGRATYEFEYRIAIGRFKARYLGMEVDEDPFTEHPTNADVLAPTKVPFNDRPATPPPL